MEKLPTNAGSWLAGRRSLTQLTEMSKTFPSIEWISVFCIRMMLESSDSFDCTEGGGHEIVAMGTMAQKTGTLRNRKKRGCVSVLQLT